MQKWVRLLKADNLTLSVATLYHRLLISQLYRKICRLLLGLFAVVANVEKYSAYKSGEDAYKQGPLCGHFAAAVDGYRIRINRICFRAVINDQADSYRYADKKDKYAKFFHCKTVNNADAVKLR